MSESIIGPGSLSSGRTQIGAARTAGAGVTKTAGSAAANAGMTGVQLKGSMSRHDVKRRPMTEAELDEYSVLRKTGKGDTVIKPKVIGQDPALRTITGKSPFVVMHGADVMNLKVWRECQPEAGQLLQADQPVPQWMLYREGETFQRPADQPESQQKTADRRDAIDDIIDDVATLHEVVAPVKEASLQPAEMQRLYAQLQKANAVIERLKKNQAPTIPAVTYEITVEIPGFGDVDAVADWLNETETTLTLGYRSGRSVFSPKPDKDKQVATFVAEVRSPSGKVIYELAVAGDTRFTFPAFEQDGIVFQQFIITRRSAIA